LTVLPTSPVVIPVTRLPTWVPITSVVTVPNRPTVVIVPVTVLPTTYPTTLYTVIPTPIKTNTLWIPT
jgi:hypothetical protein